MLQGKAFSEWWWGSKFVAAAPKHSFKPLSTKERNKFARCNVQYVWNKINYVTPPCFAWERVLVAGRHLWWVSAVVTGDLAGSLIEHVTCLILRDKSTDKATLFPSSLELFICQEYKFVLKSRCSYFYLYKKQFKAGIATLSLIHVVYSGNKLKRAILFSKDKVADLALPCLTKVLRLVTWSEVSTASYRFLEFVTLATLTRLAYWFNITST